MLYGNVDSVDERHRHRYEVNPKYVAELEKQGMVFTGQSEDGNRMEVMELSGHSYYVGVQYHPEYLSRPLKPSAPFVGFILSASNKLNSYLDRLGSPLPKRFRSSAVAQLASSSSSHSLNGKASLKAVTSMDSTNGDSN